MHITALLYHNEFAIKHVLHYYYHIGLVSRGLPPKSAFLSNKIFISSFDSQHISMAISPMHTGIGVQDRE